MRWVLQLLDTAWAYRIGLIICAALIVSQCTGRVKAEHALARSEKALTATKADLSTCKANTSALKASIDAQNRAVEDVRREGEARVAQAEKAVSVALKGRAKAEASAARLLNRAPVGADVCARSVSAFEAVKGELR